MRRRSTYLRRRRKLKIYTRRNKNFPPPSDGFQLSRRLQRRVAVFLQFVACCLQFVATSTATAHNFTGVGGTPPPGGGVRLSAVPPSTTANCRFFAFYCMLSAVYCIVDCSRRESCRGGGGGVGAAEDAEASGAPQRSLLALSIENRIIKKGAFRGTPAGRVAQRPALGAFHSRLCSD